MIGQILGGSSPHVAIKYQIMKEIVKKKVKANVDSDRYWGDVEFGWNYKF